jgi:acyl carrier protein
MSRKDFPMEEKLSELLADLFRMNQEEITDSLAMKDVDVWDSLKHMELIVAIESQFGIDLTIDEITAMRSVKEIRRVLKEKGVGG